MLETSLYFGKKMPIYLITVQCVKTDFDDHKFTQGGEKRMNTVQSDSYAASAYAQNTTKTQKEETAVIPDEELWKDDWGAEAFR